MTAPAAVTTLTLQVPQQNLAQALSIAGRVGRGISPIPILHNTYIGTDRGRLIVQATDLDIFVRVWAGARILEEGALTVPSKLLQDTVNGFLPATVDIAQKGSKVELRCGAMDASIATMAAEDYPRVPELEGEGFEVDSKALAKALKQCAFAAATDDTRPVLNAVFWNGQKTAGADGFRLSIAKAEAPGWDAGEAGSVNLPRKTVAFLIELLSKATEPVRVIIGPKAIRFALTDIEVYSTLIDGTFPNYRQLIPTDWRTRATFELSEMRRVLHLATIYARDGGAAIRLQFLKDGIRVSGAAAEVGDGEGMVKDATLEGEENRIALDPRYLREALEAMPDGKVVFEMTAHSNQALLRPEGDATFTHIVMPRFVNW